jgi:hypothetical protein
MTLESTYRSCLAILAGSILMAGSTALAGTPIAQTEGKATKEVLPEENWQKFTITPVTTPIFFEDPVIHSEIRPIFAYHRIDPKFVNGGGNVQVYALQARWAVTDRLALIATKDGVININSRHTLEHRQGWADVALGAKYALIDDRKNQFILTPGFTAEIPVGNEKVFQGTGKGGWNLFVSTEKGFDKLHLTANVGVTIPNDQKKNNSILHYSAQVDYYACRWFIPFAAFNGYTVLTAAEAIGLDTEGYDLINFGSSAALHRTQGTMGFGFRSRLLDNLDFGAAYDFACISPHGLTEDRLTVDLIWRF